MFHHRLPFQIQGTQGQRVFALFEYLKSISPSCSWKLLRIGLVTGNDVSYVCW